VISAGESDSANNNASLGARIMPIPATSIAVGEPSGQEGYIGISVGRAGWCSRCRCRRSARSAAPC
jgi:hypothetical protein